MSPLEQRVRTARAIIAIRGYGLSHGIKIPTGGRTNGKLTHVTRNFPTRHRISYFVLLLGDFTAEAIDRRKHLIGLTFCFQGLEIWMAAGTAERELSSRSGKRK